MVDGCYSGWFKRDLDMEYISVITSTDKWNVGYFIHTST